MMDITMDVQQTLAIFRGIERVIVAVAGFVCIVLAALLYKWGVFDKIGIKVEEPFFGSHLYVKCAGPGVVFCFLGVLTLIYCVTHSLTMSERTGASGDTEKSSSYSATVRRDLAAFLEALTKYQEIKPDQMENVRKDAQNHLKHLKNGSR